MSMVITPFLCCTKKQQSRLFTWLSFGSAQPSKVAQFSVGANMWAQLLHQRLHKACARLSLSTDRVPLDLSQFRPPLAGQVEIEQPRQASLF
jgi:hypothetical protein